MEVLQLPGYSEEEKTLIAQRYIIPKQLEAHGLTLKDVKFGDDAVRKIIADYTREAGLRNLEREIATVCRKAARRHAEGQRASVSVVAADIPKSLGPPKFFREVADRTDTPGVATGLAWTPVGGDILFIEAARMPGSGKLILTGQLGDVMKESAQAALSLVKARSRGLGIAPEVLEKSDIHVHVPAGATPKDGPSAGVAMFVALSSLLTGRAVRSDVAMTGEISLRGLVLPIGGVKEKVLAALRAGIKTVMLPERNRRDLEDIPADAREQLQFRWIRDVDEALETALNPEPVAVMAD
jgi:ATP-dependent Lon protease